MPTTLPSPPTVPGGDGEAVQPPVDVRRRRGHLDLAARPGWRRGARARPGCRRWSRRPAASGSIAAQVAASHQASSRGVPSTGRLPEPSATAVSSSVTVKVRVASVGSSTAPSRKAIRSTPGTGRPVPLGRRGEAEPLVEPVRGGHRGQAGQHDRARSPRSRKRSSTQLDQRLADARAAGRPGRPPASGTRPRRRRRDLAPRRARRADRDRAEDLVRRRLGHPQLGLAVAARRRRAAGRRRRSSGPSSERRRTPPR